MNHEKSISILSDCNAMLGALQREHAAIEDALYTLCQMWGVNANIQQLLAAIDVTTEFYEAHFTHEEAAFADCGYTGAVAHQRSHAKMLRRLRRSALEIRQGSGLDATVDFAEMLAGFHHHIDRFDREAYAAVLQDRMRKGELQSPDGGDLARLLITPEKAIAAKAGH